MTIHELAGLLLAAVAVFGYVNHRVLRLPDTLGNLAVGIVASSLLVAAGHFSDGARAQARELAASLDFPGLMFDGLLGLLLFAGSLHVDVEALRAQRGPVIALATVGVLASTAIVGAGTYLLFDALGTPIAFAWCLVFGALISPTDPIAVLSVLERAGVPRALEARIAGESLFNDGTAVVAFLVLVGIASGTTVPDTATVARLVALEVGGGLLLGAATGAVAIRLLAGVDSPPAEITTTLAVAVGGYALAERLHVSAPLAVVVAGLVVGNRGARVAMSEQTRRQLFAFWEVLDEVLNLLLFALIGIELVAVSLEVRHLLAGLLAVPIVLGARWLSVALPSSLFRSAGLADRRSLRVLTWGGLRGGISIALALSLPPFDGATAIVTATWVIVVFSLLVQGTTLAPLAARLAAGSAPAADRTDGSASR